MMKTLLKYLVLVCFTTANAHDIEVNGIYYNIISSFDKTIEVTYKGDSCNAYKDEYIGHVTIPATIVYKSKVLTITRIGEYAFNGCVNLTSIDMPESVTYIDRSAFEGCIGLKSITIPNGVECICWETFKGCVNLENVKIPNSVREIDGWAFENCSKLTDIVIPNSVVEIGRDAFKGCTNLTSAIIGCNVCKIWADAFEGCTSLKTLSIIDNVKEQLNITPYMNHSYNNYSNHFSDSPLEIVYLGRNLHYSYSRDKEISESPFYRKKSLTKIIIGQHVTHIGEFLFKDCMSIKEIIIHSNTPPEIEINTNNFNGQQYMNIKLYVPAGTLNKYKSHKVWGGFWNIEEL